MFSQTRGDVVLGMDFTPPAMDAPGKGGRIGVGTWLTQAEFKDIKVTAGDGEVLYQSDFSAGMTGWTPLQGPVGGEGWRLAQTAGVENCRAVAGDKKWKDYTYTLKARKLGGRRRFPDPLQPAGRAGQVLVEPRWVGQPTARAGIAGSFHRGCARPHRDRPLVRDPHRSPRRDIRCYLDGKLIHDVQPAINAMYAVASRASESGDVILKVVNAGGEPRRAEIELAGLDGRVKSAAATVLTSATPEDENTLEEPTKVAARGPTDPQRVRPFRAHFPGALGDGVADQGSKVGSNSKRMLFIWGFDSQRMVYVSAALAAMWTSRFSIPPSSQR